MRLFPPAWVPCDDVSYPTLRNYFPKIFQLARTSFLGYFPSDKRDVFLGVNEYGEGLLLMGDSQGAFSDYRSLLLVPKDARSSRHTTTEWVKGSVEMFKEYAGLEPKEILEASTMRVPSEFEAAFQRMPYYANKFLGVLPSEMPKQSRVDLENLASTLPL